jgi:diaminohydroxyphosphoribosylaminopyrimidine deaminase/5-amino-6-(5-phosphoribosylamino)uracil reductase
MRRGGRRAALAAAGIAVTRGVARRRPGGSISAISCASPHRPLVSLKLAQTADGFAGTADRRPIMITGPVSFLHTHLARAEADALMVGVSAPCWAMNPKLNCRLPGLEHRSPMRVVARQRVAHPAGRLRGAHAHEVPTRILLLPMAPIRRAPRPCAGRVDVTRWRRMRRAARSAASGAGGALGLRRHPADGRGRADAGQCAGGEADLIDELTLMTGPPPIGAGLPAIGPALAAGSPGTRRCHRRSRRIWGADRVDDHRKER